MTSPKIIDMPGTNQPTPPDDLRDSLNIDGFLLLYEGDLAQHQGIDLMIRSFAWAHRFVRSAHLVIVGGDPEDVFSYRALAARYGVEKYIHFLGRRPARYILSYLPQADILLLPRTGGHCWPDKIQAYLQTGRAILATNLRTHTQYLHDDIAMLAPPEPMAFGTAMLTLLDDSLLRERLARAAAGHLRKNA